MTKTRTQLNELSKKISSIREKYLRELNEGFDASMNLTSLKTQVTFAKKRLHECIEKMLVANTMSFSEVEFLSKKFNSYLEELRWCRVQMKYARQNISKCHFNEIKFKKQLERLSAESDALCDKYIKELEGK